MSTHNIGFYEDLTKIIFELSSNKHLISSPASSATDRLQVTLHMTSGFQCFIRIYICVWSKSFALKLHFYGISCPLRKILCEDSIISINLYKTSFLSFFF